MSGGRELEPGQAEVGHEVSNLMGRFSVSVGRSMRCPSPASYGVVVLWEEKDGEVTTNPMVALSLHRRLLEEQHARAEAEAQRVAELERRVRAAEEALRLALPVLEIVFERGRLLERMTQPDMSGIHPLQGELDRWDYELQRKCRPLRVNQARQAARASLALELAAALAQAPADATEQLGGETA